MRPLLSDADISLAYPVVRQLRPHLDRGDLIAAVERQRREGFRCVGLFVEGVCLGFAGYRIHHMLAHGRTLYVDDLVTEQNEHGNGYGTRLLEWLVELGRKDGCDQLHLDSGCHRTEAHAFYFRRGLRISSFHFNIALHPGEHG
ncbi:GNAT family N-acetyltransferase [Pseudoxanthomonas sp. CAU 1598]|uniref:GNAT family N-acetyltransferase n=1 Tax=Pseudomarimonas arenosa TaxID=2774145 RepID=A0AAW3ZPX6_9GAMM|nr:GNAT family N-acetyltransferase [Pseudomarimonas arenosa]